MNHLGVPEPSVPASVQQEQFYFVDALSGGRDRNNVTLAVRLRGELRRDALRRALDAVVDRQAVLRTGLHEVDGVVRQRRYTGFRLELPLTDLSGLPPAGALATLLEDRSRTAFDLAVPPVRAELARLAPDDHVLVWVVHHVIWDPPSTMVFARELARLYEAPDGRELPPVPVDYVQFAGQQRAMLASPQAQTHARYWQQALRDVSVCEVPPDRPRDGSERDAAGTAFAVVDSVTAGRIADLAWAEDATPFIGLLAAFVTMLHRWTGGVDVTVGTATATRPRRDLAGLIGCFVNMVVLRTNMSGDPSFRTVLGRVRAAVLEAFAHHELPFQQVVSTVGPRRDPTRHPVFQIEFTFLGEWRPIEVDAGDLTISVEQLPSGTAGGDLSFLAGLVDRELHLSLAYDTGLYREATARGLLDAFGTVLRQVAADPETRLSHVTLGATAEAVRARPGDRRRDGGRPEPSAESTVEEVPGADDDELAGRIAAEVVAPLLNRTGVRRGDDFFALGGGSLQAITVIARVRTLFHVEVSLPDFFREPTAACLARLVRGAWQRDRAGHGELQALLSQVERMTDAEVAHALASVDGDAGIPGS